ncbi:MAG: histidine phosphatase family protein [Betaproteobacteria bacterium]|nr:histidine phosphatase family protein [Betaproteobacteria bacterium]
MRHGSVDYFDASGRAVPPDGVALNARGVSQARAAGALFAAQGVQFDTVITSGLTRTDQTAHHVLEQVGAAPTPHRVPALQEIRPGRLADIAPHELERAFTQAFSGAAALDARFLGGESLGELMQRTLPAFDAVLQQAGWQCMLLVLHGGVNRALLSYMLTGQRQFLGRFEQTPACINVIDVGERDFVVRAVNIAPTQLLHPHDRLTTMEMLYHEFRGLQRRSAEQGAPHVTGV